LYQSTQVHPALEHPDQITAEHMRRYWTDGFIAVNNVFTPAEVQDAIDGLLHLVRGGNPESKGVELEEAVAQEIDRATIAPEHREQYVRYLMWFIQSDPRLTAMYRSRRLLGICERLIGSRLELAQDMALLKPPHIGREKPWPQDT